jgi:Cft2 family RNA processing exonuclease
MRQKQKPTSGIESTLRYSNRISEQFKYESSQSPEDIPRAASISEVSESERITQKISAYESNNDSMFRYQGVYKPIRRVIKPQRLTQEAAD